MSPDEVRDGMTVRVTTDREVADHTWTGRVGVVWGTFDRGETDQWVYVRLGCDGFIVIGFRPDELDAVQ